MKKLQFKGHIEKKKKVADSESGAFFLNAIIAKKCRYSTDRIFSNKVNSEVNS